ncbi:hypothetical protein IV38_GL001092 [Lactobacillus selangorensis]|uniref:Uncharacterized protein n=1 Tax=Lactobacillus selangorensis TaxID=81857 RepID=A0A0R2FWM1_9LACO|nr:hypothetical protein [Lactobacillus selangorensis]KRN28884.1 hypothetical protein IV38_GL001092 [Lactobacillus selangorensis]KRN32706.1 hypothetical protein IV40_GL000761 [Lactobacillus selangorensis]
MTDEQQMNRDEIREGADHVVEKGYVTELEEPKMVDADWSAHFCDQVGQELHLRSLTIDPVVKLFQYRSGADSIIYDPERYADEDAVKDMLQQLLGYQK